jgi:hypothetical protein
MPGKPLGGDGVSNECHPSLPCLPFLFSQGDPGATGLCSAGAPNTFLPHPIGEAISREKTELDIGNARIHIPLAISVFTGHPR